MKYLLYRSTLIAACLTSSSNSYGQFQVVHDVPNTTTTPKIQPLILDDGSVLTYQWVGEHILRKYNSQGLLEWNRTFELPNYTWVTGSGIIALERDGAGGVIIMRYAGKTTTWLTVTSELYELHYQILRVDADGELTQSVEFKKEYEDLSSIMTVAGLDVSMGPDGSMVAIITYNDGIEILKFSSAGELVFSRCLGNGQWNNEGFPFPTYPYSHSPKGMLAVSADGSIYYSEGDQHGANDLRLAKVDGLTGDLIWMKRFVYGNTPGSVSCHGVFVDANGDLHVGGSLNTSVGRFHLFLRLDPDGELERADIYRTPLALVSGLMRVDQNGVRYHWVSTANPPNGGSSHGILKADTLGTPALFMRRDDQIVLPNNVFIPLHSFDVKDDLIAVSGLLHHEHVDLAYTTRYETLLSFQTDDLFSCFMNDTSLAHIEVPLDIITSEDLDNAVSLNVMPFYHTQQATFTMATIAAEPLDTLCTYGYNLLGVEVGMHSTSLQESTPLIRQNLLHHDAPILLNAVGAARVEIWNSNGALVHATRIATSGHAISTNGWNPGMYVVRALDRLGVPVRMERLLLE